jgi:hypothetical protein
LITSLFSKGLSENPNQRRGQAAQRLVINRRNGFGQAFFETGYRQRFQVNASQRIMHAFWSGDFGGF